MELTLLPLLINGAVVLLFIILSAVLVATGSNYAKHIGDVKIQTPLKWRILRIIVFMVFVGIATALFDIAIFAGFLSF